jgi:DNA-binding response OmpR family regulator
LPKLLLIDDNPVQLRIRETVLRDAGFDVTVATTAASALALLKSETEAGRVGGIITDHVMPGASGADFVRELRKINSDVPVIVVSGMVEAEGEYEGLNVTFRQKPCPPPELIALAKDVLKKKSA